MRVLGVGLLGVPVVLEVLLPDGLPVAMMFCAGPLLLFDPLLLEAAKRALRRRLDETRCTGDSPSVAGDSPSVAGETSDEASGMAVADHMAEDGGAWYRGAVAPPSTSS